MSKIILKQLSQGIAGHKSVEMQFKEKSIGF
jgi:hypothetical protein